MSPEQIEILQKEVERGKKAKLAYDTYVKDFVADSKKRIHDAFDALSLSETDKLADLKLMQYSIDALNTKITDDITTMEMAEQTLLENEEN